MAATIRKLRLLTAAAVIGCALAGSPATCPAASPPNIPDFRVGDRAEADVFTPIPLVVFDPVRTGSLRQSEVQRTPPVFRYNPAVSREAEEALKAAFAETRARFASDLEKAFSHPLPLLAAELAHPTFGELVNRFREQQPEFPLTSSLAELWALDDPGDVALTAMLAQLRRAEGRYVRGNALPAGERLSTASIRIIAVEGTNSPLALADVDRRGRNLARTNVVTLAKRRQDALAEMTPDDPAGATYALSFLRPNLTYDFELTLQARARRVEAINAADQYSAGQRLIGKGEIVTARTKLALDELRSRTAVERVQASAARERATAEAQAMAARQAADATRRANYWLIVGLGAAGMVLCGVVVAGMVRRRALARASLETSLSIVSLRDEPNNELAWRERALAAEARAQKATAMLRASLLPHLARWMMNELVQRLLSQRSQILTGQQKAEREVAELAARLEEVHAPLEDRLRAYEQRIADLEAELAAKGEQNLDLIKAKIETTRKQMEGERSRLDWN